MASSAADTFLVLPFGVIQKKKQTTQENTIGLRKQNFPSIFLTAMSTGLNIHRQFRQQAQPNHFTLLEQRTLKHAP